MMVLMLTMLSVFVEKPTNIWVEDDIGIVVDQNIQDLHVGVLDMNYVQLQIERGVSVPIKASISDGPYLYLSNMQSDIEKLICYNNVNKALVSNNSDFNKIATKNSRNSNNGLDRGANTRLDIGENLNLENIA